MTSLFSGYLTISGRIIYGAILFLEPSENIPRIVQIAY